MNAKQDADDHLAVVKNFMDGKQARETRRITRDLSTRINPTHLTTALAAALPHVAKDDDSGNHFVGLVFTRDNLLVVASSGWTVIVCRTPADESTRVTGDVVADSVMLTPTMAKQLMGFAALTPREAWDPQLEVEVTGTGPDKLRLRATDRTGLFTGKSLTLPVDEPTQNLAKAAKVLESMAGQPAKTVRTYDAPAEGLSTFITSAKKWGTDFDIESITPALWRITGGTLFYGLITQSVLPDDDKAALATRRGKDRDNWQLSLTGVGQELVKGFEGK